MQQPARRNRIRMLTSWQLIRSFFSGHSRRNPGSRTSASGPAGSRKPPPARLVIVAMVAGHEQREVLSALSEESWDIRFAESRTDAWESARRFTAPVILYDRDWPDLQWRSEVQYLASLPHRPCVILTSRVSDDYLWEELIRQGGYELLAKPLRAPDAARVIRLAIIYWKNMAGAVVEESKTLHSSRS